MALPEEDIMAARKKNQKKAENNSNPVEMPETERRLEKGFQDFPVVGIGASAGGLEAFSKFFENMPADSGMAFVLNQHLDPTHASNMVDILRRYTKMPVIEAQDGMKLEPNHVYMVPPNRDMTIIDHSLKLVAPTERPGISHSIDLFFRSLARDLKDKAIAIILSGTGTDGTLGAKAVKAEMGMVMVQDPSTARYDGMPQAAISAGAADFVLSAEEMPQRLKDYVEKYYGKIALRHEALEKESDKLSQILALVRAKTRHDFSGYKQATIKRRIERRMGINQIDTLSDYLKLIEDRPAEIEALIKDFLINVTAFFRDPEAFIALKAQLEKFLADKPEGYDMRVWVPGCATGEEAYSIAIVLEECLEELKKFFKVQVFGTDLDQDAIVIARSGIYPLSVSVDVGEERLKRFFNKTDGQYQITRDLREKLVFAVQDIIADPPFTRMDLISARNLLIYLNTDLQKKLIPMFHYALNPGGFLFLGTAETVGEFADNFSVVDRRWRIYKAEKKGKPGLFPPPEFPSWQEITARRGGEMRYPAKTATNVRLPEQVMLEAMPPSILLDDKYQIVFTHGDTSRYIGLPQGKPSLEVQEMVRLELRAFLISGLHEAASQGKEVVREGGFIKVNGARQPVRILIKPVKQASEDEPPVQYIVTFQEMPKIRRRRKSSRTDAGRCEELEKELQFTRETLRGTIEELETANEELRSANEEYQSTNEELQSTNEELETSREELQSVNEELSTVNNEHQKKIEELASVNDDMKNLLGNTGIATIFLDTELKLQRFTPNATRIFNFIETDIGRPIGHVTHQLEPDSIVEKAQKVLETLVPVKEDVQTQDGKWYSMRINPYRTGDNKISGVGIIFIDIGEQERMRAALAYAQSIIDTLSQPVVILNAGLRVISANRTFYHTFQVNPEETENRLLYELGNGQWDILPLRKLLEEILPRDSVIEGYAVKHTFPRIGFREIKLNARRLRDEKGATQRILLAMEDVTEDTKPRSRKKPPK